jgi:hypothetical protein
MTQKYLEQIARSEAPQLGLPKLERADRIVTTGGSDRFLVQVKRGRVREVIDLLTSANGYSELRLVVKALKLGVIENWEPLIPPF